MAISRRQFLALGAATSAAVGLLGGVTIWSWWDIPPSDSYQTLHEDEARTLRHIAGAAFPGGETIALQGKDAKLDRFFDELLLSMGDNNRKLLKLLINSLENLTKVTHFSAFSNLSENQQRRMITEWLQNDNHLFRGGIQSLVLLLGMGYTSHPEASATLSQYFRCGFGQ